eukprot:TRINITY_DN4732_c0_g1_i1.p1 TRINITY_DN4732_c0_g1~~TRINITY_DN4732_c0_g1_i1.p1  ORF type:complete len:470 (-),score=51.94 TRINITY_DN4732_c0_g1_i1:110-1519(-)
MLSRPTRLLNTSRTSSHIFRGHPNPTLIRNANNPSLLPHQKKHFIHPIAYHGTHSHHDHSHTLDPKTQTRQEMVVTYVGLTSNIVLASAKGIAGVMGNSSALVADAIHMLGDCLSDVVTVITLKLSRSPKTSRHPYGKGRIESMGALFVSSLLTLSGLGMGYHTLQQILLVTAGTPTGIALWVSVVSVVVKEALFQGNMMILRRSPSPSPVILANAWHHRSDALSSLVALVGVVGAQFGFPLLDPLSGLLISYWILKTGFSLTLENLRELTDEAISQDLLEKIKNVAEQETGVKSVHNLRARKMGANVLVDLHAVVPAHFSVSAAHQLSDNVRRKIRESVPNVSEVLIHTDVVEKMEPNGVKNESKEIVNDELICTSIEVEPRMEDEREDVRCPVKLERDIKFAISQMGGVTVERVTSHYLRGSVEIDICVVVDQPSNPNRLKDVAERTRHCVNESVPSIRKTNVYVKF